MQNENVVNLADFDPWSLNREGETDPQVVYSVEHMFLSKFCPMASKPQRLRPCKYNYLSPIIPSKIPIFI